MDLDPKMNFDQKIDFDKKKNNFDPKINEF